MALSFTAVSLLSACGGDDGGEQPAFIVTPSSVADISYSGGDFTIDIFTDGAWKITSDVEWLTFNTTEGSGASSVTVAVDGNPEAARTATATVSSAGVNKTLTFSQISAPNDAALPAAAGPISGDDKGGIDGVVLSVREIEYAVWYKWYRDGEEVALETTRTYVAKESGTYTVAGVNAKGEGPQSPGKTVTLTNEKLFVDELTGRWMATSVLFDFEGKMFEYFYELEVFKKDNNTVEIYNFCGAASEGLEDIVVATVDNENKTFTIMHPQQQVPSWSLDETMTTYVCPKYINSPLTANFGLSFPPFSIIEVNGEPRVELITDGEVLTIGGYEYYGSYVVIFANSTGDYALSAFMQVTNCVWERF